MNTPIAAIQYYSGKCFCLNRRQCVIFIAILEMIGSILSIIGYWLAYYKYPNWKKFISIPSELENETVILGFINTLTMLGVCRFLISIVLFDGILYVKLGQIRFWLTSLLTYKVVVCVLIIGMQLAGSKAPKINAVIFITVFLGLMEMLYVYAFVEEEVMKRNYVKEKRFKKSRYGAITTLLDYEDEVNMNNNGTSIKSPATESKTLLIR